MKKKEIKRILGLVVTATMITGCGKEAQMQQTPDTTIEVKAEEMTQVSEEKPTEETTPIPKAVYTISFANSNNTSIEAKEGDDAKIPEYQGIKLTDNLDFKSIKTDDEGYYCIGSDRVCSSDNVVMDEDAKTVILKNISIPYEVRYVVNTEDDSVYPVQLIEKEESVGSGICVNLAYEDEEDGTKTYTFKGITDMVGRAIDNAEIYRGEFKGWSKQQESTDAEYLVGNNVNIMQNMTLYPIFDTESIDVFAVAEGNEFKAITNDTKGIVATVKWGNISVNGKGRLITDSDASTIDQASGIVSEVAKATAGTQTSAAQQNNTVKNNNSNPNIDPYFGSASDADWAAIGVTEIIADPDACDFSDPYGLYFE